MPDFHDRPCAAAGLQSYRYQGRYGFVMIGARNCDDAMREAVRSIEGPAHFARMDVWSESAGAYVPVAAPDCEGRRGENATN